MLAIVVVISIVALIVCFKKIKELELKVKDSYVIRDMQQERIDELYKNHGMLDRLPSVIYENDKEYILDIRRDYNTNLWVIKYICDGKIVINEQNRGLNNVVHKVWKVLLEVGLTDIDWSK